MNFPRNRDDSDVSELSVPDETELCDSPLGATKCLNKKFGDLSAKINWAATKNQSFQGRSTGTNVSTLMARLDS